MQRVDDLVFTSVSVSFRIHPNHARAACGLEFPAGHSSNRIVPNTRETSSRLPQCHYGNVTASLRMSYDSPRPQGLFSTHEIERRTEDTRMKRFGYFLYGLFCYLVFVATLLYAIGFIGNLVIPRTLDGVPSVPVGQATAIDVALLLLFALQHSIMARRWFKDR